MLGMARQPASLGTRIRRARERKRMKRPDVAAALGVSLKTIDNWENDRTNPRDSLGALGALLGEDFYKQEDGTEPNAIDEAFGDKAAEFRAAVRRIHGPDADRKLRLVEEALAPPAGDGAHTEPGARPSP
jgi:transcriptional regulator with XRE-family HTH domain